MKYGLIGASLKHSYSKDIHSTFDYGFNHYKLHEVKDLKKFFANKHFKGINVTIPYKEEVIKYLDDISNSAKKIQAVNVVKNDNGVLKGYNTDYDGFSFLLEKNNVLVKDINCLVLGDGGASKAIIQSLIDKGAKHVYVANRKNNIEEIDNVKYISYDEIYGYDYKIIVNTTNVGMYPKIDEFKFNGNEIQLDKFKSLETVIDIIYNPRRTRLLYEAKRLGINTINGLDMLIYQAIKTYEIFFDKRNIDENLMYEKAKNILPKTNTVLIGMSGCGKTNKGIKLAKELKKEFIDTDKLIIKREGMSIKEIFSNKGEKYFRNLEKEIIKEVSLKTDVIISTGGGVILDEENIKYLQANGEIVFLDVDVENIIKNLKFDGKRPLLQNEEDVRRIYQERIELYKKYSDRTIKQ